MRRGPIFLYSQLLGEEDRRMLEATLVMVFLGLGAGLLLAVASRIFYVWEDPKIVAIKEVLPGANCGGCGEAGCAQAAEAMAQGRVPINLCVVGGWTWLRRWGRFWVKRPRCGNLNSPGQVAATVSVKPRQFTSFGESRIAAPPWRFTAVIKNVRSDVSVSGPVSGHAGSMPCVWGMTICLW